MGMRFFKRARLLPGLSMNWSMGGPSMSFGPRGAKLTLSKRGLRSTAGIPGTGLYYTKEHATGRRGGGQGDSSEAGLPVESKLNKGFFARLFMPAEDKVMLDACKAFHEGRKGESLGLLRECPDKADAMYLAGAIHMSKDEFAKAADCLKRAYSGRKNLGREFGKLGIRVDSALLVTDHVVAYVMCRPRGVTLMLAECMQRVGEIDEARKLLRQLLSEFPDDPVVKLSYVDVLLEKVRGDGDRELCKRIVKAIGEVENSDEVGTSLLHAKGQALCGMGMHDLGSQALTLALRRKKGRGRELLSTVRYDRAMAYLEMGHDAKAKKDLQAIYLEDPGFRDVEKRLGI